MYTSIYIHTHIGHSLEPCVIPRIVPPIRRLHSHAILVGLQTYIRGAGAVRPGRNTYIYIYAIYTYGIYIIAENTH